MLAACGGERNKKEFLGTPQTPAEGEALCTPDESPKGTVITLPGGPAEGFALCRSWWIGFQEYQRPRQGGGAPVQYRLHL